MYGLKICMDCKKTPYIIKNSFLSQILNPLCSTNLTIIKHSLTNTILTGKYLDSSIILWVWLVILLKLQFNKLHLSVGPWSQAQVKATQEWLIDKKVNIWQWSSQNPNLNLIKSHCLIAVHKNHLTTVCKTGRNPPQYTSLF